MSTEPSQESELVPVNLRVTSAIPSGFRDSLPAKMTSSILSPRRVRALCSPRTQWIASPMLLLPHPLGPTTAVIPAMNRISVRSWKDLKPMTCSLSILSIAAFPGSPSQPERSYHTRRGDTRPGPQSW